MIKGLFNSMTVLERALDVRAAKHRLLSSNVANQETPGYKSKDIDFKREMSKAATGTIGKGKISSVRASSGVLRTHEGHMPVGGGRAGSPPKVINKAEAIQGYDENSVSLEREMVKLSENTLMYNTTAKLIKGKFNSLMTAIKARG